MRKCFSFIKALIVSQSKSLWERSCLWRDGNAVEEFYGLSLALGADSLPRSISVDLMRTRRRDGAEWQWLQLPPRRYISFSWARPLSLSSFMMPLFTVCNLLLSVFFCAEAKCFCFVILVSHPWREIVSAVNELGWDSWGKSRFGK